jgi:hypothetical protein
MSSRKVTLYQNCLEGRVASGSDDMYMQGGASKKRKCDVDTESDEDVKNAKKPRLEVHVLFMHHLRINWVNTNLHTNMYCAGRDGP